MRAPQEFHTETVQKLVSTLLRVIKAARKLLLKD